MAEKGGKNRSEGKRCRGRERRGAHMQERKGREKGDRENKSPSLPYTRTRA